MASKSILKIPSGSLLISKQPLHLLQTSRGVQWTTCDDASTHSLPSVALIQQICALSAILAEQGYQREADAFKDVCSHCTSATDFGGLGMTVDQSLNSAQEAEVLFLISAYLESLNSADRAQSPVQPLQERPEGRRGMTMAEKIFAAHDIQRRGEVKPGDVILVDVDWVIASELSWSGMEKTYNQLGNPGIFRSDRLYIAGDHVVDPRNISHPKIKPLVEASERARQVFKMTEYQGMNYTIMHTEFCREKAQPGMLVIGSDSHTCSAGSMSCLAIGLGVADVTMPLIIGQTWFKVPETVEIRFINEPAPGLGGKDVILYILKELKRNTVAAERVVEYTGPGLKHLSCDARFAICNMTTEFGGVTGVFVPDEITYNFVNRRKSPKYKRLSTYYRPDDDAEYAETHIIDLAKVESFVARYPSPDDVVPVADVAGVKLDGCFIGACTTAEADLILAGAILKIGLEKGMKPVAHGKRKVVPGSRPILHKLRKLGLVEVYEQAGFEIGVPGCSYCVGMSADKAGKGEVWLSSQNRNFENRMGPGAIGSIASAVTVAVSSFDMKIADPKPLLDEVDLYALNEMLGFSPGDLANPIVYMEPGSKSGGVSSRTDGKSFDNATSGPPIVQRDKQSADSTSHDEILMSKVQRLGDFIDTDALAPAEALADPHITTEKLGTYCLMHTHPEFRRRVKEEGQTIVVAGKAFGVGSSRENAVIALQGAGVECVIAKSFAFIYGRNQPNLGLLGFVIEDGEFYEVAVDGVDIAVDLRRRVVEVGGKTFGFQLSEIEGQLVQCGGITPAFQRWGKGLFDVMCSQQLKGEMRLEKDEKDEKEAMKW